MRKTVHKWFLAWSFDKEEIWLNQMAAQGWALVDIGFGRYSFEPCQPGEYSVRLELLDELPTHHSSQAYIQFVEETGAEYLGSIMRWVYFRKQAPQEDFRLLSDNTSRIRFLNRVLSLLGVISVMNLSIGLGNLWHFFGNGVASILTICLFNIAFGLLCAYGFWRIFQKRQVFKKNLQLFE